MIYLSNEPYPQEISVPRSFGVIVPQRNTYLSTADIAADLETDSDQKVLAASQGVVLKEMVDAKADASDVYTKTEVDAELALKADADDVYTKQEVDTALAGKQDELVAGENITIEGNVISATGGGGGGDSYTRAETDALLAEKADADDVYTKSEVDTALAGKANANAVYTKGEVDAELADKQDVITDLATIRSGAAAGANAVQPAELSAVLATKQDALVSGTNIKTINNQSLLGSGNIVIQGGGGEPEVFWAEYGVTTYQQIVDAYNAGKLVACRYNNNNYTLVVLSYGGSAWFGGTIGHTYRLRCNINDSSWGADTFYAENSSNRQNSIPSNPDNYHYLSTKAVYDALGKYGVVSQTQTWTGSASTGYTYTMSNQVWGLIPQAFIDEVTAFVSAAAGITFNETTGYFELNGLTDISYDEIRVIWATRQRNGYDYMQPMILPRACRTNFTLCSAGNGNGGDGISISSPMLSQCNIEYFRFSIVGGYGSTIPGRYKFTPYGNLFYRCNYLRIISDNLEITRAQAGLFTECYSLEWVAFYKLAYNVDLHWSPNLRTDCLAYTINNAGTAAITITLHATAYARAIADADVQAALAAHTNVTLASN